MLCIDLSSHNEPPDFRALKAHGVGGVWIKATEGVTYTNPSYLAWVRRANEAGVRVGAYHYARPDNNTAAAEAAHFCTEIGKPGRRDLRPVLDYEELVGTGANGSFTHADALRAETWIRDFNGRVKSTLGVGPLFYSYPDLIRQLALPSPVGWGLWLASYGSNDGKEHPYVTPPPWQKIAAHQYTSKGWIGSYGPVDLSSTFGLAVYAHPLLGLV